MVFRVFAPLCTEGLKGKVYFPTLFPNLVCTQLLREKPIYIPTLFAFGPADLY